MRPETFPKYDCKLDNLRFYVLFNSISVIPGGQAVDNETVDLAVPGLGPAWGGELFSCIRGSIPFYFIIDRRSN